MKIEIAPSLLACDFGRVKDEVARCVEAGADLLHLDFMDGHFVPNLSFGFPITEVVARDFPDLRLDVHLMVRNPAEYIERLADIGVDQISIHWEATDHVHRVLTLIKDKGIRAGLAFNPHTPVEGARWLGDLIDTYLLMTVNPGFGGQSFLASQLPKIREARALAEQRAASVRVCVDGGVDDKTAPLCLQAGADVLVAGSYLFKQQDRKQAIDSLRQGGQSASG